MSFSWLPALFFVLGAAALKISSGFVTAALAGCVAWALLGPRQAIQALALSALITYWNPTLATFGEFAGGLDRLVLMVAAIRVLPFVRAADLRLLWPLWLFALISALTSSIASAALSISIMKVITFVVATSTVLVAFNALNPRQLEKTRNWLLTLVVVVAGLSAVTAFTPSVGYALNGRGLQGVLNQPQSFGTYLAPYASWLVAGLLLSRDKLKPITGVVAVGFLALVFLSQARTAAVAILLGVGVAVATRLLGKRREGQVAVLQVASVLVVVALSGLLIVSAYRVDLGSELTKFVFKRGTETTVSGAFLESRGNGAIGQWEHFTTAPLTGHGFGVYADGSTSSVIEFFGIPISAPVEKGFVPTAVLEETGLAGGLMFFFAVYWFARGAWRSNDLRWIAMFVSAIGVNAGEAVILAPGGVGLLIWLSIGLSCVAWRLDGPASRVRESPAQEPLPDALPDAQVNVAS